MEPEYEKYINLVRREVWKRVRGHADSDYDELLSAGNLAFMEASETWKEAKGAFSTHLWHRLRFRLGQACEAKKGWEQLDENLSEKGSGFFCAQLSELSQEAKWVVNLIFSSGEELVDLTAEHVRTSRSSIRQYLLSVGWTRRKIAKVFTEIKETVT